MSVESSRGELTIAMAHLEEALEEIQHLWRDARSRDFEKQYIQPLRPQSNAALTALTDIGELLARVKRDCQ
ncbi:MAG: putative metal-dependent hydrolase [Rhodothermales bacterium]|jgi:predicted metal-dependent hydrolase